MREDDLLVEKVYQQARADEFVWQKAKTLGMSRKKFLQFMTVGAGIRVRVAMEPKTRLRK